MNFEHKQRKRRKQESKDQEMIGPHFVTFRRSLLFEAKCQRMSMVRCLWGLEKDYRFKFKSVICVHYSVGCKHLLCRLVYYSVSSLRSKRFQSSYSAKFGAGAKKMEGGGGREKRKPPPPPSFLFLLSFQFFRRTRAEPLATQATLSVANIHSVARLNAICRL